MSVPYQRQSISAAEVIKNLLFSFLAAHYLCVRVFLLNFLPPNLKILIQLHNVGEERKRAECIKNNIHAPHSPCLLWRRWLIKKGNLSAFY